MAYAQTVGCHHYVFDDLRTLLARASPDRSGDRLAGLAAGTEEERIAARMALSKGPLRRFLVEPVVASETDEVIRIPGEGLGVDSCAVAKRVGWCAMSRGGRLW